MADTVSETMGGIASGAMEQAEMVGIAVLVMLIFAGIFFVLWRRGIILNNLRTEALNFEERGADGEMVIIDSDQAGVLKTAEGLKYKIRNRDKFINPPPLKMINRLSNGKDLVFLYWADRDEAYAFRPRRYTASYIIECANEAYKKAHTTEENAGTYPQTKEEFFEGLKLIEKNEAIFFRPAIDESSANLVITELANIDTLYSNKLMTMLREWAPMIGLALVVLITVVGFLWIKDGLSSMTITCISDTAAQAAQGIQGIELPA